MRAFDNVDPASAAASGVNVYGDPNMWVLLGKAWQEKGKSRWMKSTKVMQVPGGVVMQTSTQESAEHGRFSMSEALQFIPGVQIDTSNGFPVLVSSADADKSIKAAEQAMYK